MLRQFIFAAALSLSPYVKAENILIIGDSHTCGNFGAEFFSQLADSADSEVTLYCASSSSPQNWWEASNPPKQKCYERSETSRKELCGSNGEIPAFKSLLEKHSDAKVIIALGTNTMLSPTLDRYYENMLNMIEQKEKACIWIGPPHLYEGESKGFPKGRLKIMEDNISKFYENLEALVKSRCRIIDSRPITETGAGGQKTTDGVHRAGAPARAWADAAAAAVKSR